MKIYNIDPRFLSESYDEFKDAITKFKKRFPIAKSSAILKALLRTKEAFSVEFAL